MAHESTESPRTEPPFDFVADAILIADITAPPADSIQFNRIVERERLQVLADSEHAGNNCPRTSALL